MEGIISIERSAAEIREKFYVLIFLLFSLKEEKSHFFLAKDARLVSEEKKKKIYPSHSGNFCNSVISGIVISNDSTKRERLKKCVSVHIMIAGRTFKNSSSARARARRRKGN